MPLVLTPSGLLTQTQAEIVEELTAKLRATFGNNTNTSTSSIFGQLVNIVAEFRALDQQVLLAVYRSFDPNGAVGTALDRLASLTGSIRKGATVSVVDVELTFTGPGTTNPGDLIQNDDNLTQWELVSGPHTAVGPFPETINATYASVSTGPILANAGTNWSQVTVIPGLSTITNLTDDADPGQDQEPDPDFRIRRQTELFAQGQGPLAAIRARVSKVSRVTTVNVYHNPATNPVDADGIPFKAFNVVVETNPSPPPADLQQEIFDATLTGLGVGGEAYGTDFTGTSEDIEGQFQEMAFDLVSEVDIFVLVTIDTTDTEQQVSTNIVDVVTDAILEKAQANFSGIGQNQLGFEYEAVVANLQAAGEITGATDVTVLLSRVSGLGPYVDPVEIGIRERPSFESVNIIVNVV